jgi:predicted alpha/beta superfamily hydrolase
MLRPDGAGAGDPPVTMPRSLAKDLQSADGREYRLLLAWPSESPPASGFPVIYVLDPYALFGTIVESVRMRSRRPDATGVAPAVVAGIGYPGDEREARVRRNYDYTPLVDPDAGDASAAPSNATGGATDFLAFIETRLKPAVERIVPVDVSRQTLFGHSLGGRFVLQTLLSSPASFATYVAVSPSVWLARHQLLEATDAIAVVRPRPFAGRRTLITVGEYEQSLAPWQRGSVAHTQEISQRRSDRRMVDDAREMAARLEAAGADVRFDVLAGEDHASAVLRSVGDALRFCAAPTR